MLPFEELAKMFQAQSLPTNDEGSFVMGPQTDDLDGLDVVQYLVYKSVLDANPTR